MMRLIFWVSLALMLGVYLIMLFWTLPHLTDLARGLVMFDLHPGGYSYEQARSILNELGRVGRAFYRNVQHPLDTIFPGLMALVLTMSFNRIFPRFLAFAFSVVAVLAASFDYLENAAVAVMLAAGPDGVTGAMAATASHWTVLKSGTVSMALAAFLVGLALVAWRRRKLAKFPQSRGFSI